MLKVCSVCKESKTLSRFSKSSKHLSGIYGKCKECKSATNKRSYRKTEEKYVELTQKELKAKVLYMEATQAEWYREEGKETKGSRDMFKEYAKAFWDQVESRNQQGEV